MKRLRIGLLALVVLAAPGCKKAKECSAGKVDEVKKWIDSLCAARMAGLARASSHVAGTNLVEADVAPVRTLPRGNTYARREPGRLWVDGNPVLEWSAEFGKKKKSPKKPRPKKKRPAPAVKVGGTRVPHPGKGAGMLGVLAKMDGKTLGSMFSRTPPHPAIKALKKAVVKGDRVYLAVAPKVPAVCVPCSLEVLPPQV